MDTKTLVASIDDMVSRGNIVNAVKAYFADNAQTRDYNGLNTEGKQKMIDKMENFTGSIAEVNTIKLHRSIVEGQTSASEFTFDFTMKDGSHIHWHEIIRRTWNDSGKIEEEVYFNANS